MKREWKPGDVARTVNDGTVARTAQDRWVLLDDGHGITLDHEPRPLVVIDPEDREQVERLTRALDPDDADYAARTRWSEVQAALRSLVAPPKPAEPTGLGAVVEDASGDVWVRVAGDAISTWHHAGRFPKDWRSVDAVKVLHKGLTQ